VCVNRSLFAIKTSATSYYCSLFTRYWRQYSFLFIRCYHIVNYVQHVRYQNKFCRSGVYSFEGTLGKNFEKGEFM
jgi:hypothetical protein